MKTIRVWFSKDGECRFISHLDLNRVMLRAVKKSHVPVWHTEGFNPHPFITFALPLSLGFRGKRESMDFRLVDEEYPLNDIPEALNACLPEGIRVYSADEPKMKPSQIAFARFNILLNSETCSAETLCKAIDGLFAQDEIIIQKKTKSGIKDVDLKPMLGYYITDIEDGAVRFNVVLPAGSSDNVNPSLLINALEKYYGIKLYADITRETLFDARMREFV